MASTRQTRPVVINLRTTPEIRDALKELAGLMGEELGAKLTQTQALEILITEALRTRTGQKDQD